MLRKALFHTVIIQIAGTVEMGHFAHLRVTTYKIHILPYKNHIQILKIRNYPRLMTKQARTCLPRDLSGIVQVAAA